VVDLEEYKTDQEKNKLSFFILKAEALLDESLTI
jgi:hypothetical protein